MLWTVEEIPPLPTAAATATGPADRA